MRPHLQFPADFVTFTKENFNGKLHFFVQWQVDLTIWDTLLDIYQKLSNLEALKIELKLEMWEVWSKNDFKSYYYK